MCVLLLCILQCAVGGICCVWSGFRNTVGLQMDRGHTPRFKFGLVKELHTGNRGDGGFGAVGLAVNALY